MANYTLHLGYRWDGPLIGALWSKSSTDYRYLNYALASSTGAPAWFQFALQDNLYVQLWDLSSTSSPIPSAWILSMSLGSLTASTTYLPSSYLNLNGAALQDPAPPPNGGSGSYFQLNDVGVSYGRVTGPWGSCRGSSQPIGPVSFIADLSCELSFCLQVTVNLDGDPTTQVYVSDPETIVGSGSQ